VLPQATKRNVKIVTEVAPAVAPIVVDGDKIHRVITNLLANAVKFTQPQGTVKMSIDVAETAPEDRDRFDLFEPERNQNLRIQVMDTGIGIPDDKLERIFEAFYQVDNSSTREFGGTGLGLAIVRNFVNAHHGRIEVKSKVGMGSTFTVLIPYVGEEAAQGMSAEIEANRRSA
jgi:signal transduction histidine kinase